VLLESTVTGFNAGGGGISIVDHSVTTSVARAGSTPQVDAAIATNAAATRSRHSRRHAALLFAYQKDQI
jgi:hypothetical protein